MRALLILALTAATLSAQSSSTPRLGTISFPNSGAAAAQPDFIRGVLLMHSFEYDAAAVAFRAAQAKDPGFALAYWGEAMTYNHPVWNQQDLPAARAVLARLAPTAEARAAKAPTAREKGWLRTAEVLYGEGGSKERRDTLYEGALAQLVAEFPDDESRTFHALALMGLSQGVRDVDTYMRAGAIALDVFHRQSDHPGAAHYVIHAFDDPTHAPLGLKAADAYSKIAPGAAHAQHMTTHIYLALGMWDGVISQNILASGPDRSRWQPGHYTYWLHYGLVQKGMLAEATALFDTLKAHAGPSATAPRRGHLVLSRGHQVIGFERWDDPILSQPIPLEGVWPSAQAADYFTRGFAAIKRGELDEAARMLASAKEIPSGSGLGSVPGIMARELEAALIRARGDKPGAETMLRAVAAECAALPVEFGPPEVVKPPMELLGEWLREDGRVEEAKRALDAARQAAPNRRLLR